MKSVVVAFICAIICFVARYILSYWVGFYETSYLPLAYQTILTGLMVLLFFYVLGICIISLFWKKFRGQTVGLVILGCLTLIFLSWFLPPAPQILIYGLKERLIYDDDLNSLRRFASDIDKLPDPVGSPTGDRKTFMREDIAKTGLKKKYAFLHWVKTLNSDGPSYVEEADGTVDVRWGGPLSGHWGFKVALNKGKADSSMENGIKILRLSDDVLVIYEPD